MDARVAAAAARVVSAAPRVVSAAPLSHALENVADVPSHMAGCPIDAWNRRPVQDQRWAKTWGWLMRRPRAIVAECARFQLPAATLGSAASCGGSWSHQPCSHRGHRDKAAAGHVSRRYLLQEMQEKFLAVLVTSCFKGKNKF